MLACCPVAASGAAAAESEASTLPGVQGGNGPLQPASARPETNERTRNQRVRSTLVTAPANPVAYAVNTAGRPSDRGPFMIIGMFSSVLLVLVCILVHYEALRIVSSQLPGPSWIGLRGR